MAGESTTSRSPGQRSSSTTQWLAMMTLAIRGSEGDLGPVYADTFRRDLHLDLCADLVKLGFDKAFFKHSDAPGSWNMEVTGKDLPPQEQKGGYYHLEMIADFGSAFINRFKDQPMFLYLAFRGPHVPLDAPQKYLDRFPGPLPDARRKALGSIACIDDGVWTKSDLESAPKSTEAANGSQEEASG